jgi:hypothetical protein
MSSFFLERRLKEPDFKLIKPFAAEFTNVENSLWATITTSTKKRNAVPLDLEGIVLSCSPNREEAMLMKKHAHRNSRRRRPPAIQVAMMPSVHLRRKHSAFSPRIGGRRTRQEVE